MTVGVFGDYPFQATLKSGKFDVLTVVIRLRKCPSGRAVRQTRKELPKGSGLLRGNDRITLTCSGMDGDLTQNFESCMRTVSGMLREEGALIPDTCPLCRKKGCDALALVNGYVPVHRECCQQGAYDTVAREELNRVQGSYITGIVGALVGGLVGAIPTLLTIWFLERIWALLYALIPLCAYWGYRMLRGRMNRGCVVIVLLSSVFQLFAIEQIYFYMAIVATFGIWPSIFDTVSYYFQLMTPGDIVSDMAMSFIFLLIGVWIVFRKISTTGADEVADASLRVESLQSWHFREHSSPEL